MPLLRLQQEADFILLGVITLKGIRYIEQTFFLVRGWLMDGAHFLFFPPTSYRI